MVSRRRSDQPRTDLHYQLPRTVEITVCLVFDAEASMCGNATLEATTTEGLLSQLVSSIRAKRSEFAESVRAKLIVESNNSQMKQQLVNALNQDHSGLFAVIQ